MCTVCGYMYDTVCGYMYDTVCGYMYDTVLASGPGHREGSEKGSILFPRGLSRG